MGFSECHAGRAEAQITCSSTQRATYKAGQSWVRDPPRPPGHLRFLCGSAGWTCQPKPTDPQGFEPDRLPRDPGEACGGGGRSPRPRNTRLDTTPPRSRRSPARSDDGDGSLGACGGDGALCAGGVCADLRRRAGSVALRGCRARSRAAACRRRGATLQLAGPFAASGVPFVEQMGGQILMIPTGDRERTAMNRCSPISSVTATPRSVVTSMP
jgi:hypothetical protein